MARAGEKGKKGFTKFVPSHRRLTFKKGEAKSVKSSVAAKMSPAALSSLLRNYRLMWNPSAMMQAMVITITNSC